MASFRQGKEKGSVRRREDDIAALGGLPVTVQLTNAIDTIIGGF